MYFSIWLFFAINCRPKLNEGNLYLFSFNSLWLPLCINSAQVARDTVPVDTNVDESTLKSTSMVLVSVELQKKNKKTTGQRWQDSNCSKGLNQNESSV